MTKRFRFFATLATLSLACGCSSLDNCPDSRKPIEITTGRSDKETLRYESAPYDVLDAFPAKTALWFKHDLGVVPAPPRVYLSFSWHGTNGKDGGSITETAGNQSLIDCVDAHYIVVRNDTCEPEFHILVTSEGESLFTDPDDPHYNDPDACGEMPR
ncbi:MAG TPA: hypothetical protein VEQ58_08770 [Polyangiaceae bacterium]|nr:hypothetical protein [Polyangiaceae bacterium]